MPAAGIPPPPPNHFLCRPCGFLFAWNWESLLWRLTERLRAGVPTSRETGQAPRPWAEQSGKPGLLLGCRARTVPSLTWRLATSHRNVAFPFRSMGSPLSASLFSVPKRVQIWNSGGVEARRRSPELGTQGQPKVAKPPNARRKNALSWDGGSCFKAEMNWGDKVGRWVWREREGEREGDRLTEF